LTENHQLIIEFLGDKQNSVLMIAWALLK
jgi:hypothetical protein